MAPASLNDGKRRPRILLVTPEITDLPPGMGNAANLFRAKAGGLADISSGLVKHLHAHCDDFEIHVALPRYDGMVRARKELNNREIAALSAELKGKGLHLIRHAAFHDHSVYGNNVNPNVRARAINEHVIGSLFETVQPDIVHGNDWMTGIVNAAARVRGIPNVMTVHNIISEYVTPKFLYEGGIDVPELMHHPDHPLYFSKHPDVVDDNWSENAIDQLATGIRAADRINTVSPTFLNELVNGQVPANASQAAVNEIRAKYLHGTAVGIINAPSDDVRPYSQEGMHPYDDTTFREGKAANKEELQRRLGLRVNPDAPIFFWKNRLNNYQKWANALVANVHEIAHRGGQVAVIADGETGLEQALGTASVNSGGMIAYQHFNEQLAMLGTAGSDFILMPSIYEPCGIPQMEGCLFGTLPIVRRTGGLNDTIKEMHAHANRGNGFTFFDANYVEFMGAVDRAFDFYRSSGRHDQIARVMQEAEKTFTLDNTAQQYIDKMYMPLLVK